MICKPCRKNKHRKCPAVKQGQPTHCTCQHRMRVNPEAEAALAALRAKLAG